MWLETRIRYFSHLYFQSQLFRSQEPKKGAEMQLSTLRQTLINFVRSPNASWGEPTDGWGNPTDISTGTVARVPVGQADRNTARLNSGAYTREQYTDFNRQLGQVERSGNGTAYFQGDPD